MMKKYKNLISLFSSLASVVLLSTLLIIVVMAWYVTNSEATISGVSGITSNDERIFVSAYYASLNPEAESSNDDVYFYRDFNKNVIVNDARIVKGLLLGDKRYYTIVLRVKKNTGITISLNDIMPEKLIKLVKESEAANYVLLTNEDKQNLLPTINDEYGNPIYVDTTGKKVYLRNNGYVYSDGTSYTGSVEALKPAKEEEPAGYKYVYVTSSDKTSHYSTMADALATRVYSVKLGGSYETLDNGKISYTPAATFYNDAIATTTNTLSRVGVGADYLNYRRIGNRNNSGNADINQFRILDNLDIDNSYYADGSDYLTVAVTFEFFLNISGVSNETEATINSNLASYQSIYGYEIETQALSNRNISFGKVLVSGV